MKIKRNKIKNKKKDKTMYIKKMYINKGILKRHACDFKVGFDFIFFTRSQIY